MQFTDEKFKAIFAELRETGFVVIQNPDRRFNASAVFDLADLFKQQVGCRSLTPQDLASGLGVIGIQYNVAISNLARLTPIQDVDHIDIARMTLVKRRLPKPKQKLDLTIANHPGWHIRLVGKVNWWNWIPDRALIATPETQGLSMVPCRYLTDIE